MASRGKNHFNEEWLTDKRFKSWVSKAKQTDKAKCNLCSELFDIGNMGVSGLVNHADGSKHKELVKNASLLSSIHFSSQKAGCSKVTNTVTVDSMLLLMSVSHAEIQWAVEVVMSHFSLRSCLVMSFNENGDTLQCCQKCRNTT